MRSEVVSDQLSPSLCDPLVGNLSSTGTATNTQYALTQHPEEIVHAPDASVPFSAPLNTEIERTVSECRTQYCSTAKKYM